MRYYNIIKYIFTIALLWGLSNLVAQSHFSKTVEKKEGRFISGRVDASEFSIRKFDKTGLVKEIHLNIELWTLLGEPVEMYLFRWIRGNSVTASDYTVLSEASLSKYPDLLKRFQNLKPRNVEIRYYVSTELKPEYVGTKDLDVCGEKFINNLQITKNATWGSNGGATGHRDINWRVHLFTDKAGETGSELVPSSPKDWLHFINWGESGITNKRAYNTFKYAGKMTFYGVEITNMEPPMREIDAIAKEFKKRENGEEESDESEEDSEGNSDDFWEEDSNASNDNQYGDDFWDKDRIEVDIKKPARNSTFDKNVIEFAASYNIQDEGYAGYLEYNGVNQRLNPSNGEFKGKVVLKSGRNDIKFTIKNGTALVYSSDFSVNYSGKPVKLRATLTWDGHADIDLHLKDPNGQTCNYQNKNTSLASLDVDNTSAYGPENISVESVTPGRYKVFIRNYSKTPGITATVYLYVNEQLESVTNHRFTSGNNDFTIKTLTF